MTISKSPAAHAKPLRSDGAEARNRLLDAALALFAEKGFAKTSTREIALTAQVNIASISYYFGDKAGLYRAVWLDPRCNLDATVQAVDGTAVSLAQALQGVLRGFVEPLKQGQMTQQCMKLHFREMLEPTGVWQEEIDSNIKPAHLALVGLLCHHLGITEPDDDIHRLAFSIAGLGMMLHVGSDVIHTIRPELTATHGALDLYCDRLVDYAMALVDAETQRRTAHRKPSANQPPKQIAHPSLSTRKSPK